jgi:hypothetical protein
MVETADERVGPALLNETTSAELDPVVPTLFPKDGPVAGVVVQQRGVAPAEEEKMEFRKEGPGGGEVELHAGFLTLTHRNDRPLVPGAAARKSSSCFPRKEAGYFPRKARKARNAEAEEGKRERSNVRKPEAGSHFPGRNAGDG